MNFPGKVFITKYFLYSKIKMSTKHIIATINVILALLIRFSTQLIHNQSDTYQAIADWSVETNLLDFDDNNEQLMAFSEFNLFLPTFYRLPSTLLLFHLQILVWFTTVRKEWSALSAPRTCLPAFVSANVFSTTSGSADMSAEVTESFTPTFVSFIETDV